MTDHAKALLELSRIALAGDADAARGYLGMLLRQPPREVERDKEMREALAKLLIGAATGSRVADAIQRAGIGARTRPDPTGAQAPDAGTVDYGRLATVELPGRAPAPVLPRPAHLTYEAFIVERTSADLLRREGIEPSRSLLLTGAPGVGKTMAARHLAGVLALPLVTVDLASVMSSYLGQTGQNLRRVVDVASERPCVFFIDEIDALAKRRDDHAEVGELKRIVSILLLEIERWPSHNVLVAATNHPELLDRAVWRRFDRVIHLPRPGFSTRQRILASALAEYGREVSDPELRFSAAATSGRTGSDLCQLVRAAVRQSILANETAIGSRLATLALAALRRTARTHDQSRAVFCILATEHLGLSQREIGRQLAISHVQVGRLLKQSDGRVDRRRDMRAAVNTSDLLTPHAETSG